MNFEYVGEMSQHLRVAKNKSYSRLVSFPKVSQGIEALFPSPTGDVAGATWEFPRVGVPQNHGSPNLNDLGG